MSRSLGTVDDADATAKPAIRAGRFDAGDLLGPKRLTLRDREHLASISTRLRVPGGTAIFERGEPATAVYNIASGAATSFRPNGRNGRRVVAFLFAEDLCGLARGGRYVNTVQTLSAVTVFRIPLDALKTMLLRNPELQLHFLCKVTHALRESQRHAILVGCDDRIARVARFVGMMEQAQPLQESGVIQLPMTRKDIGDYLNLSAAGVGEALGELTRRRVIATVGTRGIRILDRRQLTAAGGDD